MHNEYADAQVPMRQPSILAEELERLHSMVADLENGVWARSNQKLAFVLGSDTRTQAEDKDLTLKPVSSESPAIEMVLSIQRLVDKFRREMTDVLDRVQL